MDVHIDPLEPTPRLFVLGAGHVGWHLGRLAADAGFRVHVVDDREKFANEERFPYAAEVVAEDIPVWIERTAIPPEGTKPKSKGKTAPEGSTPPSLKRPSASS